MSKSGPAREKKYFVIKKTICPECNGRGLLADGFSLHDESKQHLPNEVPCVCTSCEGLGVIRIDVSFQDALLETLSDLNEKY